MSMSFSPVSTVTEGMILYLDAANIRSYPGSGTAWRDLSDSQYIATLVNGPVHSRQNAGCFTFDGVNDYAQITLPSTITVNTLSYNVWVNKNVGNQPMTIFDQDNDSWFLGVDNGELQIQDPNVFTGYTILPNRWYNIAMTHTQGSPIYIYVNGILIYTTSNDTTSHLTTYYNIGVGMTYPSGTPNEFFDGKIAVVQMYNRALTSNEVYQNYISLRGRFGV